ncbi:hypothetical protein B0O80DRAFT_492317 [Mortierella sp. GBAus27b]|nr:hypothetical protein B0O80DRAFT_492317 [Mortierella sp. GBAus27b]
MTNYDEDDDDDFEAPSTPRSIRFRDAASFKKPPSKLPSQSAQSSQRRFTTVAISRSNRSLADQENRTQQEPGGKKGAIPTLLPTMKASGSTSAEHSIQPRSILSRSLKRPGTLKKPAPKAPPPSQQEHVVLDSEPEDASDNDLPLHRPPQQQSSTSSIGHLTCSILSDGRLSPPTGRSPSSNRYTQESVASSQGSEDEDDDHGPGRHGGSRHWSLSPDITNPFLTDLVATSPSFSTAIVTTLSTDREGTPQPSIPALSDTENTNAISTSSVHFDEGTLAESVESQLSVHDTEASQEYDTHECLICGKALTHLGTYRIEHHVNDCIDRQQREQQALQSLDMNTTTRPSRTPSGQSEFAGMQVDYLSRVRKCPICKQDWSMSCRGKGGTTLQSRKAKDKIEHMKRCAKAHKRTTQSLVYQIRIMKEAHERSTKHETSGDTPGLELDVRTDDQDNNKMESSTDEKCESQVAERDRVDEKNGVERARKPRTSSTIKRQVASLTTTADPDFESDAIITTVHTPISSRSSKPSKLRRMKEDQDGGLQLALAISLSMESSENVDGGGGGGEGSSSRPSGLEGQSSVWSMAPLAKTGQSGYYDARRRRLEREKNITTVLPYVQVQQLIQDNVYSLLFPETEDTIPGRSGSRNSSGPSSNRRLSIQNTDHDGDEEMEEACADEVPSSLKTPPYRPSRFTGSANANPDENELSRPPESEAGPQSLWNLSHLKDTRDIEIMDLNQRTHDNKHPNEETGSTERRSRLVFDRDQYVSRFMKRYLRQDTANAEQEDVAGSTAFVSTSDPLVQGPSTTTLLKGSGSIQPPPPPPPQPLQNQDDKLLSPLWSASKSRRISFKEHRHINHEAFTQALKREILGHLDVMEQQIQQAKLDAYNKILGSIQRHPIAAGLPATEPTDLLVIEDGSESDLSDIAGREMDSYPEPKSPLLRYSKSVEPERVNSSASKYAQWLQEHDARDQAENQQDVPTDDGVQSWLDNHNTLDQDQEFYQYDDYGADIGTTPFSPVLLSPHNNNKRPSVNPETSEKPDWVTEIDEGLVQSPEVSFQMDEEDSFALRLDLASKNSLLPPPLDFAKLGYHDAAFLSQQQISPGPRRPGSSHTAPVLVDLENDAYNNNNDDGDGEHERPTWQKSSWRGMTTPKRNNKTRCDMGDTSLHGAAASDDDFEDTVETLRVPSRPRSAIRFRTGLPVPGQTPSLFLTTTRSSTQPTTAFARNRVQGHTREMEAARNRDTIDEVEEEDDEEEEDEPLIRTRHVPMSSSQSAINHPRANTAPNFGMPRTPSRNGAIARSPRAGLGTPSRSAAAATTTTGTTKAKKKTAAMKRAEVLMQQSAKAVARLRAQGGMPDYKNMSLARLRLAAATFGLKEGATKGALVEQLTTIWKRLNPTPTPTPTNATGDQEGETIHISNETRDPTRDRNQDQDQNQLQEQEMDLVLHDRTNRTIRTAIQSGGYRSRTLYVGDDDADDENGAIGTVRSRANGRYRARVPNVQRGLVAKTFQGPSRSLDSSSSTANARSSQNSESTPSTSLPIERRLAHLPLRSGSSNRPHGTLVIPETDGQKDQDNDRLQETNNEGEDDSEESTEDEEHDTRSRVELNLELDDDNDDDPPASQQGSTMASRTLDRQLFEFLNNAPHFKKQYLTYKPLDLEQVWQECQASNIVCSRFQLRRFLDQQGIICFVPAHSTIGSWRKTNARKRMRLAK